MTTHSIDPKSPLSLTEQTLLDLYLDMKTGKVPLQSGSQIEARGDPQHVTMFDDANFLPQEGLQEAEERGLEEAPKEVLKLLPKLRLKPTAYYEGIHGKILSAQMLTRPSKKLLRMSGSMLKNLASIKGLRWVDFDSTDGSVDIGLK